jgi:hypothetical protein
MRGEHGSDSGSLVARLVMITATLAVLTQLIPVFLAMIWSALPGILIVIMIVGVLRAMLTKCFD